jgi:hypothetical protein
VRASGERAAGSAESALNQLVERIGTSRLLA